jgi:choline dehydrogenase-like flavoprotein
LIGAGDSKRMDKIVVVGSGASGVHFALSVLKKGYSVVMLDVGNAPPATPLPDVSFAELKNKLADPARYFLGEDYEAVIYPDAKSEFYGFPPSKNYVLAKPSSFDFRTEGFAPLFSFAQGGLAQLWTGSVYPFNDDELKDFPFDYRDLEPHYSEVARRIGVMGGRDDLERFIPFHGHIMDPLDLDEHSARLLADYERHKGYLNAKLGCYLGRSRVSTLSRDANGRKACSYCGRCLWGCPNGALYTPVITLQECQKYAEFQYIPGVYVRHFRCDAKRRITSVIGEVLENRQTVEFPVGRLILAGGTLSSSRIFMESILQATREVVRLHGLMDNRQILVPFVNTHMVGKTYNPKSYEYHQLALGLSGESPEEYVHGLITTLKTALVHPVIKNMPLDLKTSAEVFRCIRAGLGVVNVNLSDRRRGSNYLTLEIDKRLTDARLVICYSPPDQEKARIRKSVQRVGKALAKLGCVAPPPMIHVRPMGASVHYSGSIPISAKSSNLTTSEYGQSHDFENLFIVDGTTFPFLPAKNLTMTLMANAVRIAEAAF